MYRKARQMPDARLSREHPLQNHQACVWWVGAPYPWGGGGVGLTGGVVQLVVGDESLFALVVFGHTCVSCSMLIPPHFTPVTRIA